MMYRERLEQVLRLEGHVLWYGIGVRKLGFAVVESD
jgi:hypothetical protein